MNKDETLASAMIVLDEFHKDTASMLEILKGILINEYGYKDSSGNSVCRSGSASLKEPSRWTPLYLSVYLNKNTEYISFTIVLKDVFNNIKPKENYNIYGCKFYGVINPNDKMYKLAYYSVEAPYKEYNRKMIGSHVEIERKEYFDSGKCLIKSLWDMKDRQAVADFAKQVVDL